MRMSSSNVMRLSALVLVGAVWAAPTARAAGPNGAGGTRTVQYSERDVVRVQARLRFTTLIILPKTEQILDVVCGDKEFWPVSGNLNVAYVKPAKAHASTDLHLITAAGNIYSFVLAEVSEGEPDLKLFVEPKDEAMRTAIAGGPVWASAQQIDDWRQQVELAKAETREARAAADHEISRLRVEYPASLKFTYRFDVNKKPFNVAAIYHDERFTYIRATPRETPALYEVVDGKPNLVNFEFRDGLYVVSKVMDRGYLTIGSQRLDFTRQE